VAGASGSREARRAPPRQIPFSIEELFLDPRPGAAITLQRRGFVTADPVGHRRSVLPRAPAARRSPCAIRVLHTLGNCLLCCNPGTIPSNEAQATGDPQLAANMTQRSQNRSIKVPRVPADLPKRNIMTASVRCENKKDLTDDLWDSAGYRRRLTARQARNSRPICAAQRHIAH
jgi:hypothetical protein